jgi:hypothetical protein
MFSLRVFIFVLNPSNVSYVTVLDALTIKMTRYGSPNDSAEAFGHSTFLHLSSLKHIVDDTLSVGLASNTLEEVFYFLAASSLEDRFPTLS